MTPGSGAGGPPADRGQRTDREGVRLFTDRFGDFKPPEHNLLAVPIAETVFEPHVGGHIYRPRHRRQRVPLGARTGLRAAAPGRVQLGHRSDLAGRDRPGQHQRGRGPLHRRGPATAPASSCEHRHLDRHGPGWEVGPRRRRPRRGLAALPRPVRRPVRRRPADDGDRHDRRGRPARHGGVRLRHRPDPLPEWQQGVIDGHMDPAAPAVGDRCHTTRRIGGANRPAPAESPTSTHPAPGACAASTDRSAPPSTSPSNPSATAAAG